MRSVVIDHIVQHYRSSWGVWARPDFDPFLPPSDDESEHGGDNELDEVADDRATTPPPSPSPLESGRSLKRTTTVRSPQSPDEQATVRASKRNRAKHVPQKEEVVAVEWDPRLIPVPFPSSLSSDQLKQIRRHKLVSHWADAARSAGAIADPVSLFDYHEGFRDYNIVLRCANGAKG
jgi:hypothetical protein